MQETGISLRQVVVRGLGDVPVPWWDAGCLLGEGSSDPSPARTIPSRTASAVSHHIKFMEKFTSIKLKSTLVQKAKCFDRIPCLVIPASALVKRGESEMEM